MGTARMQWQGAPVPCRARAPMSPRPAADRNPRPVAAHPPVTFSPDGTSARMARSVTVSFDLTRTVMVAALDPRLGEIVLNPAAGTGGFLVAAYTHLEAQCRTAEDRQTQNIEHLPPEQLADSILQKEQRIAALIAEIKAVLAGKEEH